MINDASGDLIIVVTMATVPNDVPAPAPVSTPAVGAADIVHTMLTDDGLWPTLKLNKISFGCCYRQVFEVVVEGAAGDVAGECGPGLFGGVVLDV